jgi:hypothetical protein
MIRVWKCDHCSQVDVDYKKIQQHEPLCSFNKVNKKCYTCKYSYEEGYNGEHIPGCEIGLDTLKGEDDGKCPGWVYEYLQEERDEKINDILK